MNLFTTENLFLWKKDDFERLILVNKISVVTFAVLMDKQYRRANLKRGHKVLLL